MLPAYHENILNTEQWYLLTLSKWDMSFTDFSVSRKDVISSIEDMKKVISYSQEKLLSKQPKNYLSFRTNDDWGFLC